MMNIQGLPLWQQHAALSFAKLVTADHYTIDIFPTTLQHGLIRLQKPKLGQLHHRRHAMLYDTLCCVMVTMHRRRPVTNLMDMHTVDQHTCQLVFLSLLMWHASLTAISSRIS